MQSILRIRGSDICSWVAAELRLSVAGSTHGRNAYRRPAQKQKADRVRLTRETTAISNRAVMPLLACATLAMLAGCAGPSSFERANSVADTAKVHMQNGDYHSAAENYRKAIAINPAGVSWDNYSGLGDALVMQHGNFDEASKYYARAWQLEFQHDDYVTKGTPFWLKAMAAFATVGTAVATDLHNAELGVQSNTTVEGIRAYQGSGMEGASGAKGYRKIVRETIRDLRAINASKETTIAVCNARWGTAPCAALYRVVTRSRMCPAVRVERGVFVAPIDCLDGDPAKYSIVAGSGLQQWQIKTPIGCFSGDAWPCDKRNGGYAFLVSTDKSNWSPAWRYGSLGDLAQISDGIVAVAFDPLFGEMVPVPSFCEARLPDSLRCDRPPRGWSATYMRLSRTLGGGWNKGLWFFSGFLSPEGKFVNQNIEGVSLNAATSLRESRISK